MKRGFTSGLQQLASAALFCGLAPAETPKVDALFPTGGQRGSSFEVAASGKLEPWPPEIWCNEGGVEFTPDEKQKGKFQVTIADSARPGARLIRFFNSDGASAPRLFLVGQEPEISEREPNNEIGQAQQLDVGALPLTINGKLDPGGDVDGFAIDLKAGQTVTATVRSYSLDAPLDPLLHVRDSRGTQLGFNHDATTVGLDPRLSFRAPDAGRFIFHLFAFAYPPRADIRLAGGSTSIYRITFSEGQPPPPFVDDPDAAREIEIPFTGQGRISRSGESDRFAFAATKSEKLHFSVRAAELGSLLDPLLRILDADGKQSASADDIDAKTLHDIAFDWTVPEDGRFVACISDRGGKGGERFGYRFEARHQLADFEAVTGTHSLAVKPGEKTELKLKVTPKYDFKDSLQLRADGLPAGVTAKRVDVPAKGGEVTLTIDAPQDAPPSNGPITIWAGSGAGKSGKTVTVSLKGTHADAGDLVVNELDTVWLTVLPTK